MDAHTLNAWTRFALQKGGIGTCTALIDNPATDLEDLMFMTGEDIIVLRRLDENGNDASSSGSSSNNNNSSHRRSATTPSDADSWFLVCILNANWRDEETMSSLNNNLLSSFPLFYFSGLLRRCRWSLQGRACSDPWKAQKASLDAQKWGRQHPRVDDTTHEQIRRSDNARLTGPTRHPRHSH